MSLREAYLAEQRKYEYVLLGLVAGVVLSVFVTCSLRAPDRPRLQHEESWRCIEALGGASWSAKDLEGSCGISIAGGRLQVPR